MAINGRALRIKKGDGGSPENFTAVAGAREDSFTGERGEIDITDKDEQTVRTLLEGGIVSFTLSITGMVKDRALLQDFINGVHQNMQVEWTDSGDVLEGAFEWGSYEETGSYENSAIEFTAELRSAGQVTLTTA